MTPTPEQLRRAAHWLDLNEGSNGESGDCATVAAWLYNQADAAELRGMAREMGVSVSKVRAAIAKATGEQS